MPSPAQTEGRDLVASLLPAGMEGPEVNIRAHNGDSPGISFSFWPHGNGAGGGEYRSPVLLPHASGTLRDLALRRITHIVHRWLEVETVMRDMAAERLACDADDHGDVLVDDDMPVPAWRFHCPAPLRAAMDIACIPDGERTDIADVSGGFDIGPLRIAVHERDAEAGGAGRAGRSLGCRTIRRITMTAPGVLFSQGIQRCYLKLDHPIPATAQAALIGMQASHLIDLPGFDLPGMIIMQCTSSKGSQTTTFDISRTISMMAPPPSMRTV